MSNYKLVPVEPTPEMLDAAVQDGICVDGKPVWKRDVVFQAKWKYQQMLAAAPDVQGEPVGYVSQDFLEGKWSLDHIAKSDEGQISRTIPVFAKPPQPAEQQPVPDVEALVEALSIARDYVFSSLEEKKLALAGYPQMWRCEQEDLAMIDAALSTYRKETSHDK